MALYNPEADFDFFYLKRNGKFVLVADITDIEFGFNGNDIVTGKSDDMVFVAGRAKARRFADLLAKTWLVNVEVKEDNSNILDYIAYHDRELTEIERLENDFENLSKALQKRNMALPAWYRYTKMEVNRSILKELEFILAKIEEIVPKSGVQFNETFL